jgi:hypothetical protein
MDESLDIVVVFWGCLINFIQLQGRFLYVFPCGGIHELASLIPLKSLKAIITFLEIAVKPLLLVYFEINL